MNKVSVSIVTYNNEKEIENVLESILTHTKGLDLKVFVVDNNSKDSTVEIVKDKYKDVKLLQMDKNSGFGYAHNQVLDMIDSDYHVIVNPDIKFKDNVIKDLVEYLENNRDVVMVTPKILNEDGTEQYLPKLNPKIRYLFGGRFEKFGGVFSKWRSEYTMKDKTISEPTEIEFCTGCFMVIRTDVLKKLNGFDDRFFMYFEDADLTRRARKYGKVMFYPGISVTHVWERASMKSMKFLKIQINSMIKYFNKWKFKGEV